MRRLSKEQETHKNALSTQLNEAKQKVADAIASINVGIEEKVNGAIADYNNVLEELEGFRDELTGDMESYFDDKSEKWQEGDNGQSYSSWKDEWSGLDMDPVDSMEELAEPDMNHADNLDALTSGPDGQ